MKARGFAYVEVLIAAAILALCAVPAANAIKNGLDAGQAGQSRAAELYCVRSLMETVLAEPYMDLNVAAGTKKYNLGADPKCTDDKCVSNNCDARTVTIERKLFDGTKLLDLATTPSSEQRDTALLKIKVEMAGSNYTFSTVVAR
jgi:Tfp pilus assembly protein PilV